MSFTIFKLSLHLNTNNNRFQLTRFISCFAGDIFDQANQIALLSYNPNFNNDTNNLLNQLPDFNAWIDSQINYIQNDFHLQHGRGS